MFKFDSSTGFSIKGQVWFLTGFSIIFSSLIFQQASVSKVKFVFQQASVSHFQVWFFNRLQFQRSSLIFNRLQYHIFKFDLQQASISKVKFDFFPAVTKTWKRLERLPLLPLETLFAFILDITTPPSQMLLECLASLAVEAVEKERLSQLSKVRNHFFCFHLFSQSVCFFFVCFFQDTEEYENWKRFNWPTILEVLDEFSSVEVDPTLLLVELPLLQPRFYSISSSALINPRQLDATVGLVSYLTKGGNGLVHHGVCSSFLSKLALDEKIYCYIRR